MADKQIRIRNVKAEMLIIKAFTAAKKSGRAEILERVSEDHFGSKVGKLVWKRATILHTNKNLPYKGGWNVLVNDPVLHNKQVVQDILEQFEETEVSGKSTFVLELIKTLEFYRQKREAFKSLENAYDALSDAESQDDVSEALIPVIGAARTVTDVRARDAFFRLDTLNLIETLKIAKSTRGSNNLARTLWHQFDSINSGFSFGSLVTIAATTSGGKSAVAFINMMINFALQGLKVAGASLEMSKEQIAERQAAFVSGVPMHKIRAGKWTPEEEEHINRSSQLLLELIAKQGGSYWVLKKLDKDSSIEEILLQLYEKGSHVILIDYINLLKLPKGKDKWEALGDIAREAKLFADSHNCLVILLAQLNEEEHVKYSKAIEEHCVVGDSFVDTEKGLIRIDHVIPPNNIEKIVAKTNIKVPTAYGIRKAVKWYKKGEKDCIAINTEIKNFNVTGSTTTKVLVLQKDLSLTWKPLNKIKIGDHIAIKRKGYCWSENVVFDFKVTSIKNTLYTEVPRRMSPKLARLCGYLVSEGHLAKTYVSFCNTIEDMVEDYTELFNELFNGNKEYKWSSQAGTFGCGVESRVIHNFMAYIGCSGDSRSKEIPWSVLQSSRECAIEFLRGYFAGDMNKDCFSAVTYSKNLAKQIQVLLLKLGIVAKISDKEDSYDRIDKTKSNKYWRIWIQGNDRRLFQKLIGLSFRQQRKIQANKWQFCLDRVPYILEYLNKRKVGRNSYKTETGKIVQLKLKHYLGNNLVTYKKLKNKKFLKNLKRHFPSLYRKIYLLSKTWYYWDKVESIKKERHVVYDFSVEKGSHEVLGEGSFVANGIVVHNSDNVIIWTYPTNNRPGFIQAKQIKARNQIPYNFYLVEDFENMRAYDLLEPTGLALMLSRSSGRAYQKKTNEYFGMRRLLEIQDTLDYDSIGVPKHRFTEDIDWSALTDQAAPAPNMPDVGVVLDMVREMINFISQYEPMTAKILLDNLKSSDILAPYRDIVDDLDIPHRAKEVLGMGDGESDTLDSRKKKLLAKIQRDLITATQDIYIEGDKRVREDRKRDRVTSRSSVYDETYEQFQARSDPEKPLRKKKKRKEVVDPSVSESKWLKMDKGYAYRKKLKADNIPVEIEEGGRSPLDAMKATPKQNIKALAKAAKSKKSVKKYRQHWTLLLEDSPPSPDSIKESMLLDGGPEEPEFLLGFDGPYLDKFESNIEIVGAFLEKKVGKVESTLGILLANHFASDKGVDNWRRGFINELKVSDLAHKMISTVTNAAPNLQGIVEKDKESLPSVENIIKHFGLKKEAKKFLSQTAKKAQRDNFRGTPFVSLDLAVPKSLPSRKRYIKILRNNGFMDNARQLLDSDMIVESPYIALFSKPQLIGSITPGNWDRMNKPGLYASAVKTGVFERILKGSHKEREQLTRSVVWALTNPEYRDNIPLLESIRQSLLSFLMSIDDRGLIMGIFN